MFRSAMNRPASVRTRLGLAPMEDRITPATITVDSNLDTVAVDGVVTIREAIESVNGGANINADVVAVGLYGTNDKIVFDTAVAAPIVLTTGELPVSQSVVIDGTGATGGMVFRQAATTCSESSTSPLPRTSFR